MLNAAENPVNAQINNETFMEFVHRRNQQNKNNSSETVSAPPNSFFGILNSNVEATKLFKIYKKVFFYLNFIDF